MTVRTWVYSRLVERVTRVNARVFAKKSMTSSKEAHPFIVYKLGYNASEELAEDADVNRQFIQIFVHDYSDGENGDYVLIDEVIRDVKAAFSLANSPGDGVIAVRYLETSQDMNDETLNTVMKYVRFQIIVKE